MGFFIIIFILLSLAHWAGDFTHLSTKEMLDAKKLGTPLGPIAFHAFVHGLLSIVCLCLIAFFVLNTSTIDYEMPRYFVVMPLLLSLVITVTHFGIDVLKGKMNVWFPSLQDQNNKFHWWVFGADQYLHYLVIMLVSVLATYWFGFM